MGRHDRPKECVISASEHGAHLTTVRITNMDTGLAIQADVCDYHDLAPMRHIAAAGTVVAARPVRRTAGLAMFIRKRRG